MEAPTKEQEENILKCRFMDQLTLVMNAVVTAKLLNNKEISTVCDVWRDGIIESLPKDSDKHRRDEMKRIADMVVEDFISGTENIRKKVKVAKGKKGKKK